MRIALALTHNEKTSTECFLFVSPTPHPPEPQRSVDFSWPRQTAVDHQFADVIEDERLLRTDDVQVLAERVVVDAPFSVGVWGCGECDWIVMAEHDTPAPLLLTCIDCRSCPCRWAWIACWRAWTVSSTGPAATAESSSRQTRRVDWTWRTPRTWTRAWAAALGHRRRPFVRHVELGILLFQLCVDINW